MSKFKNQESRLRAQEKDDNEYYFRIGMYLYTCWRYPVGLRSHIVNYTEEEICSKEQD